MNIRVSENWNSCMLLRSHLLLQSLSKLRKDSELLDKTTLVFYQSCLALVDQKTYSRQYSICSNSENFALTFYKIMFTFNIYPSIQPIQLRKFAQFAQINSSNTDL